MAKRLISPVLTDAFVSEAQTQLSSYPFHWVNAMSARFGRLIPVICEEVLPKDHWKGSAYPFLRFEPLIKPILAEANVFLHFFFIPNRILWSGWEDFIAGLDPERAKPYFDVKDFAGESTAYALAESSLADYLGLNCTAAEVSDRDISEPIDVLPFLAYQCVYDHWYRNKNFEYGADWDYVQGNLRDGNLIDDAADIPYVAALLQIHNRDWEPDYFTTALPWPQRHEDVLIPFEPVNDLDVISKTSVNKPGLLRKPSDDSLIENGYLGVAGSAGIRYINPLFSVTKDQLYDSSNMPITDGDSHEVESVTGVTMNSNSNAAYYDPNGTLKVPVGNLGNASTIEDLRVARILQFFREIEGYSDNDYQGQIEGLFGIRIPDYRIDKPELIGGGRQPISISEVLQMSASTDGSAQGNLAGHAVSVPQEAFFEYNAYEHGFILGIMSIMPRTSYFQGLQRKFSRFNRFDYAWPQFATLGAQEVKNKEIYMNSDGDDTFGYQPRYMDMKVKYSEVHGNLKSSDDFWTLARKFDDTPVLGRSFLEMVHSDVDDIFAVSGNNDPIQVLIKFNYTVERALPYRAQPLI